jgi:hypothetical protein
MPSSRQSSGNQLGVLSSHCEVCFGYENTFDIGNVRWSIPDFENQIMLRKKALTKKENTIAHLSNLVSQVETHKISLLSQHYNFKTED